MTQKFLLIQLRQLGDILLTTPTIRAIKKANPDSHITFLCSKMGRLILEGNPYLDEYFYYDEQESLFSEWQLAKTLRSKNFDVVIDFMNNPRSAFYSLMSGSEQRFAFSSARKFAYTHCVDRKYRGQGYIVNEKFKLLEAANVNAQPASLILPWFESHTRPLMQLMGNDVNFANAPVRVVIAPTHRRVVRQWPLNFYAEIADWMMEHWQAHITWLWGPGEESVAESCSSMTKSPTLKAPKTTFREMAALIANCDLFVGNSNGPSHVAVAVDTPSLQIHGHTTGTSWCPDTERHQFLQSPDAGDISSLDCDAVKKKLESMKPVLDRRFSGNPKDSIRFSWTKS